MKVQKAVGTEYGILVPGPFSGSSSFFFSFLYINLEKEEGRGREKKKNKSWLPPPRPLPRIEPVTWAYVLTWNQTGDLSGHGKTLNH